MPTATGSPLHHTLVSAEEKPMPPYLTKPLLATQLQLSPDAIDEVESTADADDDIEWLLAFLSADRLACYCLYQSARPRMVLQELTAGTERCPAVLNPGQGPEALGE